MILREKTTLDDVRQENEKRTQDGDEWAEVANFVTGDSGRIVRYVSKAEKDNTDCCSMMN